MTHTKRFRRDISGNITHTIGLIGLWVMLTGGVFAWILSLRVSVVEACLLVVVMVTAGLLLMLVGATATTHA